MNKARLSTSCFIQQYPRIVYYGEEMKLLITDKFSSVLFRNLSAVIVLAVVGIGGGGWLFLWYQNVNRDITFLRTLKTIESRIDREKELIQQSSIISGRVLATKENEIVIANEAAPGGTLRIIITPKTKLYAWRGEETLEKQEIPLERIAPRSLVTVESFEAIDDNAEIVSQEILKLD